MDAGKLRTCRRTGLSSGSTRRFAVYDRVRAESLIKGGLLIVNWGAVEKSRGVYDFSVIDEEIAKLKSMNKKLILEVWWHKFAGASLPTTPQQTDRPYLPDYVLAGGGAAVSTVGDGYMARVHSAQWMDRLIALFQALGARYDADPAVEQIIISETSMSLADSTFTQDALVAQLPSIDSGRAHRLADDTLRADGQLGGWFRNASLVKLSPTLEWALALRTYCRHHPMARMKIGDHRHCVAREALSERRTIVGKIPGVVLLRSARVRWNPVARRCPVSLCL